MAGPPAPASNTTTTIPAKRPSSSTSSTSPTPTPTPTSSSNKTSSAFVSSATGASASAASTPASSAGSPPSNAPTPSAHSTASAGTQPPHLSIRPAVTRTLSAASPVSAGSPVNKMAMSSVISPMPQSPGANAKMPISMTSKEWVIPPRPKPGRKPATDTPPTKRKAQNRAAQRAFRERRAARVGELEEQLEAEKEQHDKNEQGLRDRIHTLEMEAQSLQTRCQMLENMLERQKADHAKELEAARSSMTGRHGSLPPIQHHADSHRGSYYSHHSSRGSTSSPRHTPSRRSSAQPFSISQIISPPDEVDIEAPPISCGSCTSSGACACVDEVLATEAVGCGKCTLGSRCECLEETIKGTVSALSTASGSDLKRPLPPGSPNSVAPHEKRLRSEASIETDFTSLFSSSRRRDSSASQMSITSSPYAPVPVQPLSVSQQQLAPILRSTEDKCGFCKDGTYCVCADESLTLPAILPISQQTHTPPPSETDAVPMEIQADGAVKLRRLNNNSKKANTPTTTGSRCGPGGPGTCAQCLADPKSGLFCRALSANFQRQNGRDSGCCGGGGAGGCCKSKPTASTLAKAQLQSSLGLSLSCADAYKTLASHRHFDEAADDIGAWLPMLKAAPKAEAEGRTPIEVEAASIMSVLKGFDVRFGQ